MQNKLFKVSKDEAAAGSHRRYVLVAEDAECWEVLRDTKFVHINRWQVGDVVEVSMKLQCVIQTGDCTLIPRWETVDAVDPVKFDLAQPYQAILHTWGDQTAEEYRLKIARNRPRPNITFRREDFTDTEEMSALDKAQIGNLFVRFVQSSFDRVAFTPSLYEALMRMFRYERIRPHKDPSQRAKSFHYAKFDMASNRLNFVAKIAESDPNDLHQPGMVDLARALRGYVIQYVMPLLTASAQHATAVKERNELRWLLRRHGVPGDFLLPRQW